MYKPFKPFGRGTNLLNGRINHAYLPKFNNIATEKLPGPNRKGSSSFPTIFQGRAVKLRPVLGQYDFWGLR